MASVTYDHITCQYPGAERPSVTDLDLDIADGEFLVLVGPSGCGKSTTLRMLAGLEEVTDGRIFIGDRDVTDVPARDRDIAMVFQNYALYPHMTVAENMGFALKIAKVNAAERRRRVEEAAAVLDLTPYLDRKPKALSGGQRQRVAMGRAIVRSPQVFLMDEPLSNLDAKLRVQTRTQIAALTRRLGVTTVYVTHDQVEAMTMGDRVAVLKDGHLVQVDTPRNLYDHPNSEFVAGFIGSPAMNLFRVPVEGDHLTLGSMKLSLTRDQCQAITGDSVTVGIRSEDLLPASDGHGLPIAVEMVEELGADAYVYGHLAPLTAANTVVRVEPSAAAAQGYPDEDAPPSPVVLRAEGRTPPAVGATVWVAPVAERIHFFDANGGRRLPD
ncbi:sn-glycerol-3-phosphate ABC transporter ATP-binding protein UgpC [Kocuria rhizophila]|uniref:ABC transporter ATP-binding protein n=1 Tax=Kocuria TaxID=57493 RepID=UPI0002FD1258|nr:sn-glycerol-3-phosphate ABC transporter ATP-binding protein UgpC [Kocuria rhizophila]MXN62079.1 sn-glycerol-3-phosphate ABC transporter ATP-binding protein UgpC [Bacillus sp. BGMRC0062]KMK73227.1 sugar ABC transporter ATP-binding protein [Kocuria rhizophila]MCR4525392.1 sn-glycerol-3-phosphate ABC transporter ATP-binding protein UgpC [Kocuria rhizophila]MCT1916093.1 sn-glycerol-3-phosphate ABC transporter ATP-binding protein UgpC [Kocuria rhizophila]PKZ38284.1 sn-glycerol-3-phosphate ABC tr